MKRKRHAACPGVRLAPTRRFESCRLGVSSGSIPDCKWGWPIFQLRSVCFRPETDIR